MRPVRTVDIAAFDKSRYDTQYLYQGESCVIIGSHVPAGLPAYRHHVHEHCDQIYYIVRGEMHVQLGTEVHVAGPDTLVYIPKGTPHHNWNEGTEDELHLEVLAPAPRASLPLATATEETDAGGRPYVVQALDEGAFVESVKFPGFSLNRLVPDPVSAHATMYVGQVEAGAGGPGMHVHEFDQFYFVLSGELQVQVSLDRFTAPLGSLVVLPAGVPHRQWNDGPETERHIALLSPAPLPGKPLDVLVSLAATGEAL